jgi:hypothetical protein
VQEGAQFCDATLGLIDDGKAEVNGVPSSDAVLALLWKGACCFAGSSQSRFIPLIP